MRRGCWHIAPILLVALAAQAWGQGRTVHVWNDPGANVGNIGTVGGQLTNYSTSIGGLRRSSGVTGSVLDSAATAAQFSLKRTVSAADAAGSGYGGAGSKVVDPGYSYKIPALDLSGGDGAAAPYTHYVSSGGSLQQYVQSQSATLMRGTLGTPITTLVPSEPGTFADRLRQGEEAFRAQEYPKARDLDEVALAMAWEAPESHLSLLHVLFASGGYNQAASHLKKALEIYPELPLVDLRLRRFYDKPEELDAQTQRLAQAAQESDESNLWLVLAYVEYFDGHSDAAQETLRHALARATLLKDPDGVEAAQRFLDGIAAAGKALPQAASQPTTQATTSPSPLAGMPVAK